MSVHADVMSKKSKLKVAVLQMASIDSVDENLKVLMNALEESSNNEADILFAPENSLYMRMLEGEPVKGFTLDDIKIKQLAEECRKKQIYLHLGSVPLDVDGKLFNSSLLLTPQGDIQRTYDKMHLFDIQLQGQNPIRESDVFARGEFPRVIEIYGWKIGQSICYDIRFSELYQSYARQNVDIIVVPAAFLVKTGQAHWEILLRARAIESQCYVIASAQGGTHRGLRGQRETFGHSLVVSPWGQILENGFESLGIIYSELSESEISKIRVQIPMTQHRRQLSVFY